jgi:hypothetical protein
MPVHLPLARKDNILSLALMFLFRLAWLGRIPIPLSIVALQLMLNLRVRLNINIDFV